MPGARTGSAKDAAPFETAVDAEVTVVPPFWRTSETSLVGTRSYWFAIAIVIFGIAFTATPSAYTSDASPDEKRRVLTEFFQMGFVERTP